MKTLSRMHWHHRAEFWIWTSKIIPDLWLYAVFYPFKKKSLHPNKQEHFQIVTAQTGPKFLFYNVEILKES